MDVSVNTIVVVLCNSTSNAEVGAAFPLGEEPRPSSNETAHFTYVRASLEHQVKEPIQRSDGGFQGSVETCSDEFDRRSLHFVVNIDVHWRGRD